MTDKARCERCNSDVELTDLDVWSTEASGGMPRCRNYVRRGECRCGAVVETATTWRVPEPWQGREAH